VKIEETSLPGVLLVKVNSFEDPRGYFMETWNARSFSEAGISENFVQDNFSRSSRHTLRGLHYQVQQPQGKLVRVVDGEVFDVAVDIRRSSPSFGKWVGAHLSSDNRDALWIPPGFAHGFYVLSDSALFEYKCTDFYAPQYERTISWDDADLAIDWPVPGGAEPVLSAKDSAGVSLQEAEVYS